MISGMDVLVMGAGLVGCYVGGKCAQGNAQVTFVGRPQHMTNIRESGLTLWKGADFICLDRWCVSPLS
jgi:2-dehydropantoate 2-reductase